MSFGKVGEGMNQKDHEALGIIRIERSPQVCHGILRAPEDNNFSG